MCVQVAPACASETVAQPFPKSSQSPNAYCDCVLVDGTVLILEFPLVEILEVQLSPIF